MSNREILYGRRTILEALRAGRRVFHRLLIAAPSRGTIVTEISNEAKRRNVPLEHCPKSLLDRLTHSGHHQGIALETGPYPYADPEDMYRAAVENREALFLLFLDHIYDPQNLGSLLRTAEAAGAHGVILPRHRAALVTPAAARASSGACEHLRVALVANLPRAMAEWRERGLRVFGLDIAGTAPLLTETPLDGPLGLVVGNEGEGLGKLVARACDAIVRLPMCGRVQSLNAAISGAIALYEVRRQRDEKKHHMNDDRRD